MQRMTLEQIDAKLVRWRRKLTRALNTINKLERQRARVARVTHVSQPAPMPTPPAAVVLPPPLVAPPAPAATLPPVDDGAIPGFLRRKTKPTPEAQAIVEQQARKKAQRAANKRHAKASGTAVPLSGRAAMAFIRDMASST